MSIKNKILLTLLAIIVGLYSWNTVSMDIHYKLIVTVETPEGEISGYSVHEIKNTEYKHVLFKWPQGGNPAEIRGEAVVIDMGDRGVLFALVHNGLYDAFPPPNSGPTTFEGIKYYANDLKAGERRELPFRYWPQMVAFKDINDPKSVIPLILIERCYAGVSQEVRKKCKESGSYIIDNKIEDVFGKGVSIKSVEVEITNERVTKKVDGYLSWLDDLRKKGARLNGNTSVAIKTNNLSDNLGSGSFSAGVK